MRVNCYAPPSTPHSSNVNSKCSNSNGKLALASLTPYFKKGVWYTQGRYGADLGKVIGPHELLLLHATSRLSRVIIEFAHAQTHNGGADTCFCPRRRAWIVRARPLANQDFLSILNPFQL